MHEPEHAPPLPDAKGLPPGASGDCGAAGDSPGDFALTAAERIRWAEEGFFLRHQALEGEAVRALAAAAEHGVALADWGVATSRDRYRIDGHEYVDATLAGRKTTLQLEHLPESRTLRVIEPFHHLHLAFEKLVDDPRIVEPMRALVESERVALFTDKLNLKRPREGSSFQWHQDSPYWAHFCQHLDRLPNVMLALDDAYLGNGCLHLVRGSHRAGRLPGREGEGVLGPLFTHPEHVDEARVVPVEMPAGSLLFFSPHSVHGSPPNRSSRPRRALVLTYQPAGLRMFKADSVRDAGLPRSL